ncbi:HlyD family type I secretion periplasmic adaptor subunit [Aurantiacibacter aquimixticola]|uniref:HlyD family type I secretion periplasmic adaptor subunit n=1 Tax=Aurantiacibacter aquimixticola TaxID=1958945 RepID=UPI001401DBB3|nr:HlyD family type I secretion periplasmic adaptor subunit [Aurantiacibacter aquimixticola]
MIKFERARPLKDRTLRIALLACLCGIGGFLLWSALVPLDEGVTVSGYVVAEDERKVVQHLEGGIIKSVRVREGETVEAGDVLVELENVSASAGRNELQKELATMLATVDRLQALTLRTGTPTFASLASVDLDDQTKNLIRQEQMALFRQQNERQRQDVSVLRSRQQTLRTQIGGIPAQIAALSRSRASSMSELEHIRPLLAERLVTRQQVESLEREVARIDGELARLRAERARLGRESAEMNAQVGQSRASDVENLSSQLLEARRSVFALRERLDEASDVLDRTMIIAPQSGTILNLAFTTPGSVITPGEKVMEIVPTNQEVIAQVRVQPADRDSVFSGLPVEAQLSAYKSYEAPRLMGEVLSVSADLKDEPQTGLVYYDARLRLSARDDASFEELRVEPGMPVEAFIASGERRTFLSYMVEPIMATVRRGLSMN